MTETPKKRPWFQYHLSTAVILMFVAGGLLWMNMTPYQNYLYRNDTIYGWPLACYVQTRDYLDYIGLATFCFHDVGLLYINLLINIMVNLGIIVAIAIMCEYPIRRKERFS